MTAKAAIAGVTAGAIILSSFAIATPSSAAVVLHSPTAAASTSNPAPSDDVITFYYGLKRREKAARSHLKRVSNPVGREYRAFPSRARIAKRYGASKKVINYVRKSAREYGLSVKRDASGVFVRVTGTVSALSAWTGQPVILDAFGANRKFYFTPTDQAPTSIAPVVRETVQQYFTTVESPRSALRSVDAVTADPKRSPLLAGKTRNLKPRAGATPAAGNAGTYVGGCPAAQQVAGSYSFKQLKTAYRERTRSTNRRIGKHVRMAILISGFSRSSLAASAACFGVPGRSFVDVPVDGIAGPMSSLGEGDMDVQIAQAILPKGSKIHVIEGYGGLTTLWFLMWAGAFGLKKLPDTVTASWGMCERDTAGDPADRGTGVNVGLMDSLMLRLGLAGSTPMVASGDAGSTTCIGDDGSTELAVAYPASSPYAVAVGGSQLTVDAKNRRASESAWNQLNQYVTVNGAEMEINGSGGGGDSMFYRRPWWQPKDVVKSARRTLPDISLHAAAGPPYAIHSADAMDPLPAGFFPMDGTSAASPFFAAAVATMAAKERRAGRPGFGFIAPALYGAKTRKAGAFYDITQGSNEIFNTSCCAARKGYDKATGLGSPNLDLLYSALRRSSGRK